MASRISLKKQSGILVLLLIPIAGLVIYLAYGPQAFLPSIEVSDLFQVKKAPWTPPKTGYANTPLFKRPDFLGLKQFGDVPVKVIQEQSTDPFKNL